MLQVAPEVDTVTILLREGDALRVRASRGLEEEIARGFCLAVGDGFAGTVAATRKPLCLHDAARDPSVKSDVIRERGLRALYGVPLIDDEGEVVGVAHMGSTKASDFQEEDLILFGGFAARATALIRSRSTTDQLLEDDHQRERFIGILGHDLRAPLSTIRLAAEQLLRRGHPVDADRASVERIARTSDRMNRLVSELLDFARARLGGGIPLNCVWADLGALVSIAVDEVAVAKPGVRVRLLTTIRSRIWCDTDRVAQIVSNLLVNAIEHGAPDRPVDVGAKEEGEDAVIVVHNEGPPIAHEVLPHVFEPFRRGDNDSLTGIGLGLFIAKEMTTAHGGSIEVRSEPGMGTTFIVRLPRRPARVPGRPHR